MALKEFTCESVKEIIGLELSVPEYQRPYKWSKETALVFFNDTYNACLEEISEYRIGSIILHKGKNDKDYKIVDGQQRITTIMLILLLLGEGNSKLKYSPLSIEAIKNNYAVLKLKIDSLTDEHKHKYKEYLLNNCTLVKIVTDSQQEAFQFFDSQNNRGKGLAPHDLLKSYHLREISFVDRKVRQLIRKWETIDEKADKNNEKKRIIEKKNDILKSFFENNLYPLVNWYKGKNGLYYSKKNISCFKGVNEDEKYNYVVYSVSANKHSKVNFQLTQPIINGKSFFKYTIHYYDLKKNIEEIIEKKTKDGYAIPHTSTGDEYVYTMLVNVLMFFVDKFGIDELDEKRYQMFYAWAYTLRLHMTAVYQSSIQKYVFGEHEYNKFNLFEKINESRYPSDLDTVIIDEIKKETRYSIKNKYRDVELKIYGEKLEERIGVDE